MSHAQIADGINVAVRNARGLYSDARLLLKSRRYSSAIALTVLAIEEAGKPSILMDMSFADDELLPELWRRLKSHTAKNIAWIYPLLASAAHLEGAPRFQHLDAIWDEPTHAQAAELIKQRAIYSEWRDGGWHFPDADNHPTFAREFVEMSHATIGLWKETTADRVTKYAELAGPKLRQADRIVAAARGRFAELARAKGLGVPQDLTTLTCAGQRWPSDLHLQFHNLVDPAWDTATGVANDALRSVTREENPDDPTAVDNLESFLKRTPRDLASHFNAYENEDHPG